MLVSPGPDANKPHLYLVWPTRMHRTCRDISPLVEILLIPLLMWCGSLYIMIYFYDTMG